MDEDGNKGKSHEDIERMFNQEIRDKKRTASGVFHRASRRGLVGAVRTQIDYLKGKAKKAYMGNGEIKVSNMYDELKNIPGLKELEKMDFEAARGIVTRAKKNFRVKDLAKHWGISDYSLYNKVFKNYNIEYPRKPKADKVTKNVKEVNKASKEVIAAPAAEVAAAPAPSINVTPVEVIFTGFEIKFGGMYTGKQITDRIMNYIATLDPKSKYKINFKTEEIESFNEEVAVDVSYKEEL